VGPVAVPTHAFRPSWVLWCFMGSVLTTSVGLRPPTGARSEQRLREVPVSDPCAGPHPGRRHVVVWNMNDRRDAWPALDRLEPDVCLLNETLVAKGRKGLSTPGEN
jgi:hypothetical protein